MFWGRLPLEDMDEDVITYPFLPPDLFFTTSGQLSERHGILDNLLGNREFCPFIEKFSDTATASATFKESLYEALPLAGVELGFGVLGRCMRDKQTQYKQVAVITNPKNINMYPGQQMSSWFPYEALLPISMMTIKQIFEEAGLDTRGKFGSSSVDALARRLCKAWGRGSKGS